ncbi:extracellular solute-binding protein [Granulosicoccus antarcticus]|uniref:Nickel-binding periplasmic protein n=1 Tax=Granulosicoccus antarcticus IMCC3135 TaxID=1192854 RepID=A0A2Z2NY75_9GAMM|nr:extracellular solute-binding protein [Granulosicoccus antarcticus]ASJ76402.1 Nickel-binding periplasmic protein [Granulosicoccus antarcticus IMCC3135]
MTIYSHSFPRLTASLVLGAALLGSTLLGSPRLLHATVSEQGVTTSWSMAEFGEPLYDENLTHWPYVNPDAPTGGTVVLGDFGSFDSLNSYILKGEWPRSISLASDTLMVGSGDELAAAYGLLASTVEYPADKSWIIFNLRPEARFDDGNPITAADIEFSFKTIREHGRPFLKSFYSEVESVEVLGDHQIKFSFNTTGSMKPLMKVAGLSPLSVEYWKDKDISKTYLTPGPSSSGYFIADVDAGHSITYKRVENYWGKDLPVNKGLNTFDSLRYDYYRDLEVMLEAFKAGEIDFRAENSSKRWATAYQTEEVEKGEIVLDTPPDNAPGAIQAFFFNLRRAPFDDHRVRQAINLLYDFETIKRTILYNQYERINSYFPNSEYGAAGAPSPDEVAVLEPFREQLDPAVLTQEFLSPVTDGSGRNRREMRQALALFNEAGWKLSGGKLMKNGQPLKLELLLVQADGQRVAAPWIQNMQKAGIQTSIRLVDSAQYQVRVDDFDFDMISARLNFFPPPGPELRSYYGSAAADERGSANMAGIKNPVVDELIEQIIAADSLEKLQLTTRALDRVLLWNHYVIPQFFNAEHRIAYWNRFGKPDVLPKYISFGGSGFPTGWWLDTELDSKLDLDR